MNALRAERFVRVGVFAAGVAVFAVAWLLAARAERLNPRRRTRREAE